jgi:predicted Zn-dependent protease
MRIEIEKTKTRVVTPPGTPERQAPRAQKSQDFTARMHFYAVHNAGQQLRHSGHARTRTGKKPDRMVGR